MSPSFLLSESVLHQDGTSLALELGDAAGKTLLVTLGITRIIEQESLDVTIHGSADGTAWDPKPVAAFPQKFYCGTYTIIADLVDRADVRLIRAQWKMARWGKGEPKPMFGFYVFVKQFEQVLAAVER